MYAIRSYYVLTLEPGSTDLYVRLNGAPSGAGVYIEEGGFLYDFDNLAASVISGNTPDNLVYSIPPVTINFSAGSTPFDLPESPDTYGMEATDTFTFGAPAGFDYYAWELNGSYNFV